MAASAAKLTDVVVFTQALEKSTASMQRKGHVMRVVIFERVTFVSVARLKTDIYLGRRPANLVPHLGLTQAHARFL